MIYEIAGRKGREGGGEGIGRCLVLRDRRFESISSHKLTRSSVLSSSAPRVVGQCEEVGKGGGGTLEGGDASLLDDGGEASCMRNETATADRAGHTERRGVR